MKNEIQVTADNCSTEEYKIGENANEYVAENFNFIIEIDGEDQYFMITLDRYNNFEGIESEDVTRYNEDESGDSEDWQEYESVILAKAEEIAAQLKDSIEDDDNYYICYTENSNKSQGRYGYDSRTGIISDDDGEPIAYDSYSEAQKNMPNERREEGYHCSYVIVQGIKSAYNQIKQ